MITNKFMPLINCLEFLKEKAEELQCKRLIQNQILLLLEWFNKLSEIHTNPEQSNIILLSATSGFDHKLETLFLRDIARMKVTDPLALKIEIEKKFDNSDVQTIVNKIFLYKSLLYFETSLVILGSNGSGKTLLASEIKLLRADKVLFVSAQKFLFIPYFDGITGYEKSKSNLSRLVELNTGEHRAVTFTGNTSDNDHNWEQISRSLKDFEIVLNTIISERISLRNKFCNDLLAGNCTQEVPLSKLDRIILIWNKVFKRKIITCSEDGTYLQIKSAEANTYHAWLMSDGEKAALYFLAHIIQAPENCCILIDEPETFLHRSLQKELWNAIQNERADCKFVYLTHDLDFAVSRFDCAKLWLKSSHDHSNFNKVWNIEKIDTDELPPELIYELLGTEKNILFCEGKKSSLDYPIYSILFPEYHISPVDGCFNVINYTKAFNRIPNKNVRAFGIIDSDFHLSTRLKVLEENYIYHLDVAEIENLLLSEQILSIIVKIKGKQFELTGFIKNQILKSFETDKELQICNYISTRIDNYFKDSSMHRGNNLEKVKSNFSEFVGLIQIDSWYYERISMIDKILENNDYDAAIKIFNNKGVRQLLNQQLETKDFFLEAIDLLRSSKEMQEVILNYLPKQLVSKTS